MKLPSFLLSCLCSFSAAKESLHIKVIDTETRMTIAAADLHPDAGRGSKIELDHYKKLKSLVHRSLLFSLEKMENPSIDAKYMFVVEHDMGKRHDFEARVNIRSIHDLPRSAFTVLFGPLGLVQQERGKDLGAKPVNAKKPIDWGSLEIELRGDSLPESNLSSLEFKGRELLKKDLGEKTRKDIVYSFMKSFVGKELRFDKEVKASEIRIEVEHKSKGGVIEFNYSFRTLDEVSANYRALFLGPVKS